MTIEEKSKLDELLNNAKEVGVNALKSFFTKLDIENELFDHIYNTKIIPIDEVIMPSPIIYLPDKNHIIVDYRYLQDMKNYIDNDDKMTNKVINNVAMNIVHEMLHANRVVMISDCINIYNVSDKVKDYYLKEEQRHEGHDINNYRLLLSDILQKGYVKDFILYIPIKVIKEDYQNVCVIAYNKLTKNYEQFSSVRYSLNKNQSEDEIIYYLGKLLNDNNNNYVATEIINNNFNNKDDALVASDYYQTNLNDLKQEIKKIYKDKHKDLIINKTICEIDKTLEQQFNFEEVMTETIASIVMITRNDETIDLEKTAKKIVDSKTASLYEKAGALLINKVGIDILKWFVTSAYTYYYEDKLHDIFKNDYKTILHNISDLYAKENDTLNEDNYKVTIDSINKITL